MDAPWENKRVVVTGGAGFLGSFVVEKLRQRGCREIVVPRSKGYDLVEMEAIKRLYNVARPDIVHTSPVESGELDRTMRIRASSSMTTS